MVRVVTLFNKHDYVREAIQSVLNQTRQDISHHVMSDNVRDWGGLFPPCVFVNEQWGQADKDDYCIWLSDDDYWYPRFVEVAAGYLDDHPNIQACYVGSNHVLYSLERGKVKDIRTLGGGKVIFDKHHPPAGMIDGGQVLVRRSALDLISYPYQPESQETARLADSTYLTKLAHAVEIHPVGQVLMENRTTPKSAHTRMHGDDYVQHNWWLP